MGGVGEEAERGVWVGSWRGGRGLGVWGWGARQWARRRAHGRRGLRQGATAERKAGAGLAAVAPGALACGAAHREVKLGAGVKAGKLLELLGCGGWGAGGGWSGEGCV